MGPTKADPRSDRQVAMAMGIEVLAHMTAINVRINDAIARNVDASALEAEWEEMRPLLWRTTRYLNPHSDAPADIDHVPARESDLYVWRRMTTIGDRT